MKDTNRNEGLLCDSRTNGRTCQAKGMSLSFVLELFVPFSFKRKRKENKPYRTYSNIPIKKYFKSVKDVKDMEYIKSEWA